MHTLNKKVGILGGGQLARMLCIEGHKLGLEMHVLSADLNDPAAQVTSYWHKGDVNNAMTLEGFFRAVDIITIESEFLATQALLTAQDKTGKVVQPKVRLLSDLSDRLKQKTWLENFNLPTSRFSAIASDKDVINFQPRIKNGIVLKKRRFGYDGYGTFIIKSVQQLEDWLKTYNQSVHEFIVEDFISFKRELSQQYTISQNGDIYTYPLVEWLAKDAKCFWVKGPIKHNRIQLLNKKIKLALVKSGYVGTVAFELFDTRQGLIVNEVAPRVHNSGHYSIDALVENQFSAHLKSILGATLPTRPALRSKGFAMLNLIATKTDHPSRFNAPENGILHWYGKKQFKPGRKMGHINFLSTSPDKALSAALKAQKGFSL